VCISRPIFLNVLSSIINWYFKVYMVTFMSYHAARQRERERETGGDTSFLDFKICPVLNVVYFLLGNKGGKEGDGRGGSNYTAGSGEQGRPGAGVGKRYGFCGGEA
jgi:hypothetical protein